MNVVALTSRESEPMMLIGYNLMHKAMMDMVTMVVHKVEVISEVEARLFAITVIRQDM